MDAGRRPAVTALRGLQGRQARPTRSDDAVHPAERVLGAAVLDVDQRLAHLRGDLAALGRARHLAAGPVQAADRGDDRGGAAGEDLRDPAAGDAVAPLVDGELPLLDLMAELAGELYDRRAGDALEDRAGLGRDDVPVVVHEVHVHAAELLDVLALLAVEEDDLVAAVRAGLLLRDERRRVVAAGLRRTHAAAAGPGVLLGQPQRDRLQAALEVR